MGSAGLKVDTVDVTAKGAYDFQTGTAAAAGKAVVTVPPTTGVAATMVITETAASAATNDWSGASTTWKDSFESLSGTLGLGGKTFDLSSVDYSGATSGATALTKLNEAATAALGLATGSTPFTASATALTFTYTQAVSGFTGAGGVALSASAQDIAKATPTFAAASGADAAIAAIDAAVKKVSTQRADLGAIQNRFDHTINNLNVAVENLTASESRIRDADMAQEMVQFTRNQILSQAGTAMLAQANQGSQGVLSLLR